MPSAAIIGASPDRAKYGNKSLRAHADRGWEVYAVNPNVEEVEGRPAYARLADVPVDRLDRISLYVPPPVGLKLLPEIAEAGAREVWLNPGTESDELIEQANALNVPVIQGCSIVDLGVSPSNYPDS